MTTTTYTYDNANNRLSMIITGAGATSVNYSYNSLNQLTAYGDRWGRSVTLGYDNDGNRTSRVIIGGSDSGTDTYSYDFENRLIGLVKGTGGGAGTYAYTYDYRTRRIVRDESGAGGATTSLVFSGGTSVQEYDNSATSPTVEYVRGSDYGGGVGGILYTLRGGNPSYTHENRRGDVVAKTDSSGSLTYQAQYEAFGKQVATSGSTLDRQKSNSKDADPTGLVDEGFRYRDLETGMFTSRDPAGFVDGPNLYTYVLQNPWTKFDPEGLWESGDGWSGYAGDVGKGMYGVGVGAVKLAATVPSVAAMPFTGAYNSVKDLHAALTDPQGVQQHYEAQRQQNIKAIGNAVSGLVDKANTAEGKGELFFDTFTALEAGVGLAKGAATLTKAVTLPTEGASTTTIISQLATTPLKDTVTGVPNDALVHFAPESHSTIEPGAGGQVFALQYGDISHLTPRKVETVIGPMATGGEKGGASFMHVLDSSGIPSVKQPGANVREIPEHVFDSPVPVKDVKKVQ